MAAVVPVSPASFPQIEATLRILRNKHTSDEPHEIRGARKQMAEVAQQSKPPEKGRVAEVVGLFHPEEMHKSIMRTCPQSGPGPSGLRKHHLQAVIRILQVEDIAAFAKTVFNGDYLLDLFGSYRTM